MRTDAEDLRAIALLDEPVRRALYEWVIGAGREVGRDEAAAATGVSRTLAAFHLDRLVAAGLLTPEYRRLTGRTGPGAGRPAKLYRRGPREVDVTLPARRYERAAELFAASLERSGHRSPSPTLRSVATDMGRAIGAAATGDLVETLDAEGYEPSPSEDGSVRLRNCPFHALVADHRDLVCGTNLALAEGILEGMGDQDHAARLDPQPGCCCVVFEVASRPTRRRVARRHP